MNLSAALSGQPATGGHTQLLRVTTTACLAGTNLLHRQHRLRLSAPVTLGLGRLHHLRLVYVHIEVPDIQTRNCIKSQLLSFACFDKLKRQLKQLSLFMFLSKSLYFHFVWEMGSRNEKLEILGYYYYGYCCYYYRNVNIFNYDNDDYYYYYYYYKNVSIYNH